MSQLFRNVNGIWENFLEIFLVNLKKGVEIRIYIDTRTSSLFFSWLAGRKQIQDLMVNAQTIR